MDARPRRRHPRGLAIVPFLALWGWAGVAAGQDKPAETPEEAFLGAPPDAAGQERVRPFSLTAGPEGAVLKGEDTFLIATGRGHKTRVTPYATVLVDANWSPGQDALDNASLTLRPSLGIQRIGRQGGGPLSHGAWFFADLDFRQRKGDFKDETTGRVESVNQTILGTGVEFKLTALYEAYSKVANKTGYFNDFPRIDIGYYGVAHDSEPGSDLPEGILAHHLQVALRGDVRLPACWKVEGDRKVCPLIVQAEYAASRPTEGGERHWESLGTVTFRYDTGTAIQPAITYRSGQEQGLQYDRQLIFGLLCGFGKRWAAR